MLAKLSTVIVLILVTFTNFQEVKGVMCTYELHTIYGCNLINQTIRFESDMSTVTGTHLPGFNDDNVTRLIAIQSTIVEIFPSTLIDKFFNLESVILINVQMKGFTNTINFCRSLTGIMLTFNDIASLPRYIFQNCDQLTDLVLNYNRISFIDAPAFIGLTKLKRLSLMNNQIDFLNPAIFEFTPSLETLHLTSNLIQELSSQTFAQLPFLTTLWLNDNHISTWSSTYHQSNSALQELLLQQNEISTLNDTVFFNLPRLRVLRVGSLMSEVPKFSGPSSLEVLGLSNNKLKKVSADSFSNLVNLRELDLNFNEIETINFTLTSTVLLQNLDALYLAYNNISTIPEGTFTVLGNLTQLDLYRNKIEILEAESIRPITQMRRLDVSYNQIRRIERDLFIGATNLTFVTEGNICFSDEVYIEDSDDYRDRVVPLLKPCFNFAISSESNILVLASSFVLTFLWKI